MSKEAFSAQPYFITASELDLFFFAVSKSLCFFANKY